MILACDGLFDVMNHQEVADMTHKLFLEGNDPASVAKSLVIRAVKELQTEDNVTVIVVKIDWEDEDGPATEQPLSDQPLQTQTPSQITEEHPSISCPTASSPDELPTPVQTHSQDDLSTSTSAMDESSPHT